MNSSPLLEITPATKVGWIGTGVMGVAMCDHLIRQGYSTFVFNRTQSKAQLLLDGGATWCQSPKDVAEQADVIFSIVGYPEDVREVILGKNGVLAGASAGNIVVDMTTSQPQLAKEIASAAAEKSVFAIDAPVSGGDVGAREARLSIMVGGEESAVNVVMPLLEAMGKTIVYQGGPGSGQHTKMVNQTLIATNMIGVCEALLYAHQAGLNLETVMQSVASGAAGSWSLSNLGPRITDRNFEPGFYVEHFIKDMEIALSEAERMNLDLPGLRLAHSLYEKVADQGLARKGTHALQLALAKLSNIDW